MFIYLITNIVNGKQYVGQTTKTVPIRWKEHQGYADKNKRTMPIRRAIEKYGAASFDVKELCRVSTQGELDAMEIHWIKTLNTLSPNGYNIRLGGKGGKHHPSTIEKIRISHIGKTHSEATKALISSKKKGCTTSLKGRPSNRRGVPTGRTISIENQIKMREARRGMVPWNTGKPVPESVKQKISKSLKGKSYLTDAGRRKISEKFKNRVFSVDHLRKISEANKGRVITPEWRVKISQTLTGRKNGPCDELTKLKIGFANHMRWVRKHSGDQLEMF